MIINNAKQRKILSLLIKTSEGLRFSKLSKNFNEEDKFPYHLKYLLHKNLIEKHDDKYIITNSGASQFKYFDAKTNEDRRSKLPVLALIIQKDDKFMIKKESLSLWPIWLNFGEEIGSVIEQKKIKYGISGAHEYFTTINEIYYDDKNEIVYDNIWVIYKVKVDKILKENSEFKFVSMNDIKNLSRKDALMEMLQNL